METVGRMVSEGIVNLQRALMIPGWMSETELEWIALQASRSTRSAEIGCWLGRSTRAMADNTTGQIFAVDTWGGSKEHREQLKGKPPEWLFNNWRKNMEGTNVSPMRMTSLEAASLFRDKEIMFDFIFIDASHEYKDVRDDILAWKKLLSPGGVLAGHDFDEYFPEVKQAVEECLPGYSLVSGTSIWSA